MEEGLAWEACEPIAPGKRVFALDLIQVILATRFFGGALLREDELAVLSNSQSINTAFMLNEQLRFSA